MVARFATYHRRHPSSTWASVAPGSRSAAIRHNVSPGRTTTTGPSPAASGTAAGGEISGAVVAAGAVTGAGAGASDVAVGALCGAVAVGAGSVGA